MPLDPFPHSFRERDGVVQLGAGEEQHELLAAVTPHAIDLARLFTQE